MAAIATSSYMRCRNRVLVASADPVFRSLMMKDREDSGSLSEEAVGGATHSRNFCTSLVTVCFLTAIFPIWMRRKSRNSSASAIRKQK